MLTEKDYLDILRHLQKRLQEAAPDIFESLGEIPIADISSKTALTTYLSSVINMIRERSRSSYFNTLRLLNEFIRTEDGQPLDGIAIELSPQEQDLYGVSEINLENLQDQQALLTSLESVLASIRETPSQGDSQI